jgi:hypothetical protein
MKKNHSINTTLIILIFTFTIITSVVKSQTGVIFNLDLVNGFKIFKFNDPISKHIGYLKLDTTPKKNVNLKSYNYTKKDLTISNLPLLALQVDFYYGKLYQIQIFIETQIKEDDYRDMHLLGLKTAFDYLEEDLVKAFGQNTSYNEVTEFGNIFDQNTVWETQNIKLNKCVIRNALIEDNQKGMVCIVTLYYKPTIQKINLLDFK